MTLAMGTISYQTLARLAGSFHKDSANSAKDKMVVGLPTEKEAELSLPLVIF